LPISPCADARLEPGGRNDDGIDERPLDAVEDRRFVPLVDDANGNEHHPRPDVEGARQQEIEIGLLQRDFSPFLETLDDGVFDLEFPDEPDARREAVRHHQDKPVEVEDGILWLDLVVMDFHVAREGSALCSGARHHPKQQNSLDCGGDETALCPRRHDFECSNI